MYEFKRFYIDGAWVTPPGRRELAVINPATEQEVGKIMLGTAEDVNVAVKAARVAFETYSQTSREERVALLERIIDVYKKRMKDVALAISDEMGAPLKFALNAQAGSGLGHFMSTLAALKEFEFEESTRHDHDPARGRRRVRLDHSVELAAQSDRLQSGAGIGRGLHDGAQAQRSGTAERAHLRRDPA